MSFSDFHLPPANQYTTTSQDDKKREAKKDEERDSRRKDENDRKSQSDQQPVPSPEIPAEQCKLSWLKSLHSRCGPPFQPGLRCLHSSDAHDFLLKRASFYPSDYISGDGHSLHRRSKAYLLHEEAQLRPPETRREIGTWREVIEYLITTAEGVDRLAKFEVEIHVPEFNTPLRRNTLELLKRDILAIAARVQLVRSKALVEPPRDAIPFQNPNRCYDEYLGVITGFIENELPPLPEDYFDDDDDDYMEDQDIESCGASPTEGPADQGGENVKRERDEDSGDEYFPIPTKKLKKGREGGSLQSIWD